MTCDESATGSVSSRQLVSQPAANYQVAELVGGQPTDLAVNSKFLAVCFDGRAKGQIIVGKLECDLQTASTTLVHGTDQISQLEWNPCNDSVLATCSSDCPVRVWRICDSLKADSVQRLLNKDGVDLILWHRTRNNVLLCAGSDSKIFLWNYGDDTIIYEIPEFHPSSVSFSPNASLFAATCSISKRLHVFDALVGNCIQNTPIPHDGTMSPQVLFPSESRVITLGCSADSRRQLAIFSTLSFSSPLCVIDVDGSSSTIRPFLDYTCSLVFITGKVDSNIGVYKLLTRSPWILHVKDLPQQHAHSSIVSISTKNYPSHVTKEIMKFYRLRENAFVEALSILSHQAESNGSLSSTSTMPLDGSEHRSSPCGDGADSNQEDMDTLFSKTAQSISKPNNRNNNDRKYQFLSQITRPDYRVITECEERLTLCTSNSKDVQVHDCDSKKLASGSCQNVGDDVVKVEETHIDEASVEPESFVSTHHSPTRAESNNLPVIGTSDILQVTESSINVPTGGCQEENLSTAVSHRSHPDHIAPLEELSDVQIMSCEEESSAAHSDLDEDCSCRSGCCESVTSCSSSTHCDELVSEETLIPASCVERLNLSSSSPPSLPDSSSVLSVNSLISDSSCTLRSSLPINGLESPKYDSSNECSERLDSGTIDVETNPFRQYFLQEEVDSSSEPGEEEAIPRHIELEENGNSRESEGSNSSPSYATDVQHLLENTVSLLESQLHRSDIRVQQMERLCDMQMRDMESLRFEITWKDQRIEYLQQALLEAESKIKDPKCSSNE